MASSKYEKVQQGSLQLEDYEELLPSRPQQRGAKLFSSMFTRVVIILSILCNAFLLSQVVYLSGEHDSHQDSPLTEYAGLRQDILMPFDYGDDSLWDPVWNSPQMSDSLGVIAVSQDWIKAKSLPASMRFPWDDTKHVYVLSFHHNIHCLRWLLQSVLESHTGRPQSSELEHLTHCLNVLREDTMCHADDTPRFTGRVHSQHNMTHPKAGIGQQRKCRDFNRLYKWSIENSACYEDLGDPNAAAEDFFKSCPDGRKLWD